MISEREVWIPVDTLLPGANIVFENTPISEILFNEIIEQIRKQEICALNATSKNSGQTRQLVTVENYSQTDWMFSIAPLLGEIDFEGRSIPIQVVEKPLISIIDAEEGGSLVRWQDHIIFKIFPCNNYQYKISVVPHRPEEIGFDRYSEMTDGMDGKILSNQDWAVELCKRRIEDFVGKHI